MGAPTPPYASSSSPLLLSRFLIDAEGNTIRNSVDSNPLTAMITWMTISRNRQVPRRDDRDLLPPLSASDPPPPISTSVVAVHRCRLLSAKYRRDPQVDLRGPFPPEHAAATTLPSGEPFGRTVVIVVIVVVAMPFLPSGTRTLNTSTFY